MNDGIQALPLNVEQMEIYPWIRIRIEPSQQNIFRKVFQMADQAEK
jgi:hypothetical protein